MYRRHISAKESHEDLIFKPLLINTVHKPRYHFILKRTIGRICSTHVGETRAQWLTGHSESLLFIETDTSQDMPGVAKTKLLLNLRNLSTR